MTKSRIGDERFLLEIIDTADVESIARKNGWNGNDDYLRDYCEPNDAAHYVSFKTLEAATSGAKEYLKKGTSLYGCAIIDHQVYEKAHDDRGNIVDCPPCWETQKIYEVAMDMERIEVDR